MTLTLANYKQEQQLFQQFIRPDSEQRILMFHGESGAGKSHLLNYCLQNATNEGIPSAVMQLRGSDNTIPHLFNRIGRRHGWTRFPSFTTIIGEITETPQAERGESWLRQMRRHLNGLIQPSQSADQRQGIFRELTDAWFEDAQDFERPFLVAVDTYERATAEFEQWFSSDFLSWTADSEMVRVLIAGQKTPEVSGDWHFCTSIHQLQGVREAEAWLPFAQAMGIQIPSVDFLAGICTALKGNPGEILKVLRSMSSGAAQPPQNITAKRRRWREFMVDAFGLLDLQEICFDLGVNHEGFEKHDTTRGLVMGLINFMERHGRLQELILMCRELRPHLEW
ncbi:MAG: ATP-binding protein [Anaerolineales bacterium]|nr:ATP-binding protein [Anaerolineales bacterium]